MSLEETFRDYREYLDGASSINFDVPCSTINEITMFIGNLTVESGIIITGDELTNKWIEFILYLNSDDMRYDMMTNSSDSDVYEKSAEMMSDICDNISVEWIKENVIIIDHGAFSLRLLNHYKR